MSEDGSDASIDPWLAEAADRFGDAVLLEGPGERISFSAFEREVRDLAGGLAASGIRPGQRVGLVLAPGREIRGIVLMTALMRCGALTGLVDARAPEPWRRERWESIGCSIEIPPDESPRFLADDTPSAPTAAGSPAVFTSGSTGAPKAALLAPKTLRQAARRSIAPLQLQPGDRYLLNTPLIHVSGLSAFFRCLESGATCVIPDPASGRRESLGCTGLTHLSLVAAQLGQAIHDADSLKALKRMRRILLGGGPAPKSLLEEAIDQDLPLINSYGLTETAAMICATDAGASIDDFLTAGKPLSGVSLQLSDTGKIRIGPSALFEGYLHRDGIDPSRTEEGWFETGDLGAFDGKGRLLITGRADNMFVSGGENIQPESIEALLTALPGIVCAVVAPAPHPERVYVPMAWIAYADGRLPDEKHLASLLSASLPRYMIPWRFLPWPADLAVPEGKIPRRAVAAWLAAHRAIPGVC